MTNSTSSLIAIILGLAVFAVIVAVGWRSVQSRRILRLQGLDGKETIIVASEGDKITSVATATEARSAPATTSPDAARARLDRVVSSTK
jgi:hypothetical protein